MQTDLLLYGGTTAAASMTSAAEGTRANESDSLALANRFASGLTTGLSGEANTAAELPFSGVLADAMVNLRQLEARASTAIEGLVAGRGVDIHEAMIATQKSDLAFEMALAVRGKAVAAYQALMGVQF